MQEVDCGDAVRLSVDGDRRKRPRGPLAMQLHSTYLVISPPTVVSLSEDDGQSFAQIVYVRLSTISWDGGGAGRICPLDRPHVPIQRCVSSLSSRLISSSLLTCPVQ